MKSTLIKEFERIAGDRLTPQMRVEMADCAIKIMETYNKTAALAAIETVKQSVIEGSAKVSDIDNSHAAITTK